MASQQPIARWMMLALLAGGAVLGGAAVEFWRSSRASVRATAQSTPPQNADVERLKKLVPSQSHAMADVAYHWTNLWFAAEQKNWPLAEFYFNEARSHMQWTILIRPIRKDDQNRDVDLQAIFDALDASSFAGVKMAIAQKDSQKFPAAYKLALDGCYTCHKTSAKPFLRPIVPTAPAQGIIDFAPSP